MNNICAEDCKSNANSRMGWHRRILRARRASPIPPGLLPTEHPDSFTVFRSDYLPLTKRILADGSEVDYSSAKYVTFSRVDVPDLDALENLVRILDKRFDCALVCGAIVAGFERILTRRLKNPCTEKGKEHPATLHDVARSTLALDMDSLPCPGGVDRLDLHEVGDIVRAALPPPFHSAGCIVIATAGHCRKDGLRTRLLFRLASPLTIAEAKRWLTRDKAQFLDVQPMTCAQAIYTAAPLFENEDDDPLVTRVVRLAGEPCVTPPAAAALQPPPPRLARPIPAVCADNSGCVDTLGILVTALRRIGSAQPGDRHNVIRNACLPLAECVLAGWLDEERALATVIGTAGSIGKTADEVQKIWRWCLAAIAQRVEVIQRADESEMS